MRAQCSAASSTALTSNSLRVSYTSRTDTLAASVAKLTCSAPSSACFGDDQSVALASGEAAGDQSTQGFADRWSGRRRMLD